MRLETKRLLLRTLQNTDLIALATLWSDIEVTRFMGGPRDYQTIFKILQEDLNKNPASQFDLWPVVEKATGEVVGHCGILGKEVDDREEFELVYVFAKSIWRKGYATEIASSLKEYAFEQLGLNRIIALIDPLNPASSHVAQKVGFQYEKDTIRPEGNVMQVFSLHG